jgi:hypothetical protein
MRRQHRHVGFVQPQAEVAELIRTPGGAVAGALLICPNDVGPGSNRDASSQVTVKALGYFGET